MKYHTFFFSKIGKFVAEFVVCCSRDFRLRVNIVLKVYVANNMNPDLTVSQWSSLICYQTVDMTINLVLKPIIDPTDKN